MEEELDATEEDTLEIELESELSELEEAGRDESDDEERLDEPVPVTEEEELMDDPLPEDNDELLESHGPK